MYYYVYDEFVQARRYEKDLFQIESRLTDLGISGKIGRLALFKDACELVRDEIRRGAKTVIFIGNDETVNKIVKILPEVKATFGIIPLGEEGNSMAKILGMPEGIAACDVISARMVKELDIAKVNDRCFLSRVVIPDTTIALRCEGNYAISPSSRGDIEIRNWGIIDKKETAFGNPEDGLLDIVIHAKLGKNKEQITNLKLKSVEIKTREQFSIFIDHERINGNNFKIKFAPRRARWIVGKGRLF
ncbi:MAG: diacylglycerol kinase family protein [Patescibacteria group bacterium]|nr:diacylglycerol kinase family protein [Patescibacteria group bacterium]